MPAQWTAEIIGKMHLYGIIGHCRCRYGGHCGACPHWYPVARSDPAHGSCMVHYYGAWFYLGKCCGNGGTGTQLAGEPAEGQC